MRKSMTYGIMPSKEEFEKAFEEECTHGTFAFGNDKFVGNCTLTCDELWDELKSIHSEWETDGNDEAGGWCSSVLSALGFEWI